jgi:hypothetical protein
MGLYPASVKQWSLVFEIPARNIHIPVLIIEIGSLSDPAYQGFYVAPFDHQDTYNDDPDVPVPLIWADFVNASGGGPILGIDVFGPHGCANTQWLKGGTETQAKDAILACYNRDPGGIWILDEVVNTDGYNFDFA